MEAGPGFEPGKADRPHPEGSLLVPRIALAPAVVALLAIGANLSPARPPAMPQESDLEGVSFVVAAAPPEGGGWAPRARR